MSLYDYLTCGKLIGGFLNFHFEQIYFYAIIGYNIDYRQEDMEAKQNPIRKVRQSATKGMPGNALTPRQRKIEQAKKRRRNWRKQVQLQVNKNEILIPCQCSLVVFDLECAGFLEEDITEIAAIRVSPQGEILDTYQQLVKPITKLNKRVVAMTGITEEMLKDKPALPEVLDSFFSFVGDSSVLGHDIGYNDIMNINMACRRFHRKDLFLPRFLDTERIAKRLLPTETGGKYGLDALMKYYNLHANCEHRALSDCYSALSVYQRLLQEYLQKKPF